MDNRAAELGDRHVGHREPHLECLSGRTSSYERLYEPSHKEATHRDEKDVDEGTTDSDLERPEKGAGEDEKYYVQSPPQMYASSRTDTGLELELDDVKSSRSASAQYDSPIDVTLEAGLDLVGHHHTVLSTDDRESFERSQSYDVEDERNDVAAPRRYSTPDVLPLPLSSGTSMLIPCCKTSLASRFLWASLGTYALFLATGPVHVCIYSPVSKGVMLWIFPL